MLSLAMVYVRLFSLDTGRSHKVVVLFYKFVV
jgi:hypothetical protein